MALKINDIINRQAKDNSVADKRETKSEFKVQMIHYTKLKQSSNNFYATEQIEQLADILLLSGGIKQNLVVRKINIGEFEIIAGHKRHLSAKFNVERGYKEFEFLPCLEEPTEDTLSEFNLIVTNSTQRERSDYEKMTEVIKLKQLIPKLIADEELTARVLREVIANELKLSKTKVAQLENINNNLSDDAMEKFKNGQINVSVANELAGLPKEKQEEVLQEQSVTVKEIKAIKSENETVSESDTDELPGQVNINDFPEYAPTYEENLILAESVSESDTLKLDQEEDLSHTESVSESDTQIYDYEIISAYTDRDVKEKLYACEQRELEIIKSKLNNPMVKTNKIHIDALRHLHNAIKSNYDTQPWMPRMKNNDQRKDFIDNYSKWPIWIDSIASQERYYKYDLDNEDSFVVRVSLCHKYLGYETGYSKTAEFGREEFFLLKPGKTFIECSASRTMLIDYLKEYQKIEE